MVETAYQLRPDADRIRKARGETRSPDRLLAHFEVEVRLARQLAQSSREQRSMLYSDVYRQLFEKVEDHPQHRGSSENRLKRIQSQSASLLKDIGPDGTYVEIGCGDAALTKVMASHVRSALGVDVTPVLVSDDAPASFRFVQSDGITLDIPTNSADLVYSNQLMEHLHAEDAMAQLQEIYRILKPGGRYVCCTPNRLTGPHDISVYFGYEPMGFHMREYDHRSLGKIFGAAGFNRVKAAVSVKGRSLTVPVFLAGLAETSLELLPRKLRSRIALSGSFANVAGVNMIGIK